jgi:integrase
VWKPARRRAGLPEELRFHDLRHAYATWLADVLPPNILQRLMGHEDVTTTFGIYTAVPADFLDRASGLFVVDPLSVEEPDEPEDADGASGEAP